MWMGKKMAKPKIKVTKKFLLDIKLADEKAVTNLRLNKRLQEFAKDYADYKGWKKSNYIDRLILIPFHLSKLTNIFC